MPVSISEANFEATIERTLITRNNYLKRSPADYNRSLCLDTELTIKFIQATQPATWKKFTLQYPSGASQRLVQRLARQIERRGTLHALRSGLKDSGCHFDLVFFKPNTTLNPAQQHGYRANIFSTIRQLRYRPEGERSQPEIDLALFLNGIPLFTAELKNQFTGQNVLDAIKQYRTTRSSSEPLLKLGRILAHFAIDDQLVYVAPHLQDNRTEFLPFNQGHNHGAGNPPPRPTSGRFGTSYLWEEVWSGDSVLNLVQRFVHLVDVLDEDGNPTSKQKLIFPRYHQLMAVRELVTAARANGPGHRYLVQHSAGSGKTMTIAWLAHQLSVLHDDQDEPVFDTVIVVSDRRVIDHQLQGAVRQFEKARGVVEVIDRDSQQLKKALETGKPIIVTTLQKFPVISRQVGDLPGQRFAVIVDEAHSSQSGATTQHLNRALRVSTLEEAARAEDRELEDMEDILVQEMTLRRHLPNVSTFAFTATPKAKTLQLFGRPGPDGKPRPFSLYPMRQAIQEGFILDVLEHYVTHKSYWRLLKTIETDPRYDRRKAQRILKFFVELSDHAIDQKVAIMVEHFAHNIAHRISGQAKAMIVTRSRLHAVRFKLAVDICLQEQSYPFQSLVAFSGTVEDGDNHYTETGMNTASAGERIPESATASTFKRPEYRILVVANKFQTGFDQPLLHAMYVDKILGGVNAVQTLSRLNRIFPPHKNDTMVVDFTNEADDIKKAFEPYYEATLLSEETDPNVLYQLQDELDEFHFYTEDEIDEFIRVYLKGKTEDLSILYTLLGPVVDRFNQASDDEQQEFRGNLKDFVRLYAFLAQILPFLETDWEKRFHFGRLLLRRLPITEDSLPIELRDQVAVELYRTQQTFEGSIELQRGDSELVPVGRDPTSAAVPEERDPLSVIIEDLNKTFGIKINGHAQAAISQLQAKLNQDIALQISFRVNPPETARLAFDNVTGELFADMVDSYWEFYKQVTDDPQAKQRFFDWLYDQYRHDIKRQDE